MTKRTFVDFSFKFGLAAAVALMCMAVPAKAVLFSDTLASTTCGTGNSTSSSLAGDINWTVAASPNDGGSGVNIDVLGNPAGSGCINAIGSVSYTGHYIDMHGTTTNNVGGDGDQLTSTTTFGPGSYTVQFLWGNNGLCGGLNNANCPTTNFLEIKVGDSAIQEINTGSTTTDITHAFSSTFTVGTTGSLVIFSSGNTGSDSGSLLGGTISVTANTTTGGVPEPASGLLLLLPGLAAFGWRRLRRA